MSLAVYDIVTLIYFISKISFKGQNKVLKNFHVCLKLGYIEDKYCLRWKVSFEMFFSCSVDDLLRVTYANILVATHSPLKRAPHLHGSLWNGGLETHWSYLRYIISDLKQNVAQNYW